MNTAAKPAIPGMLKAFIYVVIIALVGLLIWSQLPRGPYSTDLTRIGQGRPALVLAYDIQSMGGAEVMGLMDDLRADYEDRIHFLVAPLGAPHGRAFGDHHDAVNGTVVLFAASGAAVHRVELPPNAGVLRRALDQLLAPSSRP